MEDEIRSLYDRDGVNDAPALKRCWCRRSMASMGTDIAVEASDIALMGDNIEKFHIWKISTLYKTINSAITATSL